ncbi:resolvase [Sphingomonas sp. Leaf412]|uniref:recombinase family protein n=1 Tax=Sphingomonas sp. Leaf412 TaxID=1736370 RepID=UPI0006F607A4|nr:recombinase family protein [Sphingomonas sp. Leaf412]KQT31029.1 resolvase [Sphingomonas sp. Leaf412]
MKTIRCAIYTRKSSDEGLEQSFNSLDAQREACAAYILSQASEGWSPVADTYDDGGLSGGTLERPALQRLLADVRAGKIDIIVVYKVDRLTRSLLDFAKLVEAFDAADTSFVSVTQSFNTTTSMGRLTLNMLLSFAQFEREVTAERIRDKIAASKARGMWMGGIPPLGYKPDGRSLAIVPEHASITKHIFQRYLELKNVRLLADDLITTGIRSPERATSTGKAIGGRTFSRGQLYLMLKCVTYTGQIGHKGTVYAGKHPAIIDRDTFAQVQTTLADNSNGTRSRSRASNPSLLAGKIVDQDSQPLIATHASKGATRYRYYVSHGLHHGTASSNIRLPAREIERLVIDRAGELFRDPLQLVASAWLDVAPDRISALHDRCAELTETRRNTKLLAGMITQVRIEEGQVVLSYDTLAIATALAATQHEDAPAEIIITLDARLTRSGRVLRLVHDGAPGDERSSVSLTKLLVQAHGWWSELRKGELDIKLLAAREGVTGSYLTRVVRLAFLSPALTQAILASRHPAGLDVRSLTLTGTVVASWSEQAGCRLNA